MNLQNHIEFLERKLNKLTDRIELLERVIFPRQEAEKPTNPPPKVKEIVDAVSSVTGIDYQTLKGKSRIRVNVEARSICYAMLREETGLSLVTIGLLFGGRDHATVINGLNLHNDLLYPKSSTYKTKWLECLSRYQRDKEINNVEGQQVNNETEVLES